MPPQLPQRVLRNALAALVLLATTAARAQDAPDPEAVAAELERFQGTWRVDSMILDGRTLTSGEIADRRIIIIDDRYVITLGTQTIQRGRFQLDPTTTPRRIDTIPADGANRGKTNQGIYELSGDTLRLCYAPPGRDRPTEFSAEAGSGRWVSVDKRVGPGEE